MLLFYCSVNDDLNNFAAQTLDGVWWMTNNSRRISIGETKAIEKELEAFAGPGKPRGCEICRRGVDDQKIVAVARGKYTAQKVADFLMQTRNYPNTFTP